LRNETDADHVGTPNLREGARFHVGATVAGISPHAETDANGTVTPSSNASAWSDAGTVSKLDAAILQTEVKSALTRMGWKPAIAHAAVTAAVAETGATTLERLAVEALRRCRAIR
jgi:hypothetical protein